MQKWNKYFVSKLKQRLLEYFMNGTSLTSASLTMQLWNGVNVWRHALMLTAGILNLSCTKFILILTKFWLEVLISFLHASIQLLRKAFQKQSTQKVQLNKRVKLEYWHFIILIIHLFLISCEMFVCYWIAVKGLEQTNRRRHELLLSLTGPLANAQRPSG